MTSPAFMGEVSLLKRLVRGRSRQPDRRGALPDLRLIRRARRWRTVDTASTLTARSRSCRRCVAHWSRHTGRPTRRRGDAEARSCPPRPGNVRLERGDPTIIEPTDAIIRLSAPCVCGPTGASMPFMGPPRWVMSTSASSRRSAAVCVDRRGVERLSAQVDVSHTNETGGQFRPPFRSMPARSSIGMGRSRSRAASDSPHRTDSDRIRASP